MELNLRSRLYGNNPAAAVNPAMLGNMTFAELQADTRRIQLSIRADEKKEELSKKIIKVEKKLGKKAKKLTKRLTKANEKLEGLSGGAAAEVGRFENMVTTQTEAPGVPADVTPQVELSESEIAGIASRTMEKLNDYRASVVSTVADRLESLLELIKPSGITASHINTLRKSAAGTEGMTQEDLANIEQLNNSDVYRSVSMEVVSNMASVQTNDIVTDEIRRLMVAGAQAEAPYAVVESEVTAVTLSEVNPDTGASTVIAEIPGAKASTQDVVASVAKVVAANPEAANTTMGDALVNSHRSSPKRQTVPHVQAKPIKPTK